MLAAINLTWAIVGGGSPVSAIVSVAINALAINLTWAIVGGGSPVSAIVSVAINALLVMAANTQRTEGAAEALAA